MKVSVALEHRFARLPDGSVWTQSQFRLPFWRRYLDVFDHVRCIARVLDVPRLEGDWHRADGERVSFSAVPYYLGVAQFLTRIRRIRSAVRESTCPGDAFVLRVPGTISTIVSRKLAGLDYPFGVEVLGDPYSAFGPGAVRHPLRAFFRWQIPRQLRRQCARACAAAYVTEHTLQRRYPAPGPTIAASCLELRDEAIAPEPRSFPPRAGPVKLVFVGSLEQYYKAPDVLIRALARCVARDLDLQLTIIGDGRHRRDLEGLAAALHCGEQVRFAGQLPAGAPVQAELDRADLFVLPSRSEGLPRAMIEAMARGLPCIGSTAGGIPELLPEDAIVQPDDAEALSGMICDVVRNPARMRRMSARNLEAAKAYRDAVLQERRIQFYRAVREATERWVGDRSRRAR